MSDLQSFFAEKAGCRGGYNFRRQLAYAAASLQDKLRGHDSKQRNLVMRPVLHEDMQAWDRWRDHPAMKDRHISFPWRLLIEDDRRANEGFARRCCVALLVDDHLCGLAHLIMARDGHTLIMSQLECAPGRNALTGLFSFTVLDTALQVSQGFQCRELVIGGPVYNPRLEQRCGHLGFRPDDDGTHVHYVMPVEAATRFELARFLNGGGPRAAALSPDLV